MTCLDLRRLRLKAGLTQEQLAQRIGWKGGGQSIYMAEAGDFKITETTAIAIRAVLKDHAEAQRLKKGKD